MDISFGNITFGDEKKSDKGGGKRELQRLLYAARRRQTRVQRFAGTDEGEQIRKTQLVEHAMQRTLGVKVKDDPKRLVRALARRRQQKRRSAKRWAEKKKELTNSVEEAVDKALHRGTHDAQGSSKYNSDSRRGRKRDDGGEKGGQDSRHRAGHEGGGRRQRGSAGSEPAPKRQPDRKKQRNPYQRTPASAGKKQVRK